MFKRLIEKTLNFLGSYALAAVVLVLLGWLTFWGTWEQGRSTLYDVQTRYFESFFVVHWIGDKYPLPMPGGYLLLSLLFLNLIVGGLLRMRKDATRVGIFIVHVGIGLLLIGGFVEERLSHKGVMRVWEPAGDGQDVSGEFISYQEWELAVVRLDPGGAKTEFVIPESEIEDLSGDDTLRVTHPDLPFNLVLSDFLRNSSLERVPPDQASRGVNGLTLKPQPPVSAQQEGRMGNVPGLRGRIVERASGRAQDGLIWGGQSNVFRFAVGAQPWAIELQKRTWHLPFTIKLDKFVHEVHPGTGMARRYSSYVTLIEDQDDGPDVRKVHITMNEPLRHEGYTLYQSGWGPDKGAPDRRLFSDFAVVTNPADDWPLWSCVIIGLGLLIHFIRKLVLYLRAEARKRAAPAPGSA